MLLQQHVPLLQTTIKRAIAPFVPSFASPLCNRCRRYTEGARYPQNVAVLGGGISGLASAYFVSKESPNTKITIYESGDQLGGWIKSQRKHLPDGGSVLFEYGPRTLRAAGWKCLPTAQLVRPQRFHDAVFFPICLLFDVPRLDRN